MRRDLLSQKFRNRLRLPAQLGKFGKGQRRGGSVIHNIGLLPDQNENAKLNQGTSKRSAWPIPRRRRRKEILIKSGVVLVSLHPRGLPTFNHIPLAGCSLRSDKLSSIDHEYYRKPKTTIPAI